MDVRDATDTVMAKEPQESLSTPMLLCSAARGEWLDAHAEWWEESERF